MDTKSTVKVVIRVRGPEVTYGNLTLMPNLSSREHGVDVRSFTIRRGNDRFAFDEMPVARALFQEARDDIVYHTFEADDADRVDSHAIDFEIPSYNEVHTLKFRAVERDGLPDMLFYEVEDDGGDWQPVADVMLVELLPQGFLRILETLVVESLTDHNLGFLPMADES